MNYKIREIVKDEYPLLDEFLFNAIFIPDGAAQPPKTIINAPELQVYVEHFGERKGDNALVAEVGGKVVGACWTRIMNDYGHIDDDTPSLAISLYKDFRGIGIGTALLKETIKLLSSKGYRRISLSVQKANFAVRMYEKSGFRIIEEKREEYIMARDL
ncbi:MAG: GNAT family N-acetyltransferase [Clostridia bacterium]|nr:GNAT family N-acetyltransferase [Clostridia bacterium]